MQNIEAANRFKNNCAGCTACQQVCPQKCILMKVDSEGFYYPIVESDKCNGCGICVRICPWLKCKPEKIQNFPIVYACKHRSDSIRLNSTSGGVFSSLAEYVISLEGVVYGAMFVPESQRVEHRPIMKKSDLKFLRGSKYVQSYLGDTFAEIANHLKNRKNVLFVGTPCQSAGLKAFLKKDYDTLYVVDILCHGAPSPKILDDTLKSYDKKVNYIRFRDKNYGGWRDSYHFSIHTNDSVIKNNTFLTLFFRGVINRPSCHNCRYTTTIRDSDITIGDYWNIASAVQDFEDRLGVSCVLINNSKGLDLFEQISNTLIAVQTPLNHAIQDCMSKVNKEPKLRRKFWNDYNRLTFSQCMDKYGYYTVWERFKGRYIRPIYSCIKKML